MKVLELECPGCRVKLRLRDHLHGGKTFGCPDCARELILVEVGGTFDISLSTKKVAQAIVTEPATIPQEKQKVEEKAGTLISSRQNKTGTVKLLQPVQTAINKRKNLVSSWLSDPWTVAWLLALGFTFLFIRIVLWPRPVANPIPKVKDEIAESTPVVKNIPGNQPEVVSKEKLAPVTLPEVVSPQQNNHVEATVEPDQKKTASETVKVPIVEKEAVTQKPVEMTVPQKDAQAKVVGLEEIQADGTMKQSTFAIKLGDTLNLTLKKFKQKDSLIARVLLVELEPLTGVEIQINEGDVVAKKILAEKEVQLPELENVTVGALLEMVAKKLELKMVLGEQVIYFQSQDFMSDKPLEAVEK